MRRKAAFTIVELLVVVALIAIMAGLVFKAVRHAQRAGSLALSSGNLRNLAVGGHLYLHDHEHRFWKFREHVPGEGIRWWFGFEPTESLQAGEGNRWFYAERGPLGGYTPRPLAPDPSFALAGKPFKPKYRFGYVGAAYNILLADIDGNRGRGWMGIGTPVRFTRLEVPERVAVFATSAQVNTFQQPASPSNPMIEEFYGMDDRERTIHFRHNGKAAVAFGDGSVGHLEMDPSTQDMRAPEAMIGRFAPVGDSSHLR